MAEANRKDSIIYNRNPGEVALATHLHAVNKWKEYVNPTAVKRRRVLVAGAEWLSLGSSIAVALAEFGADVVISAQDMAAGGPTLAYMHSLGHTNTKLVVKDLSVPGSGKEMADEVEALRPETDIYAHVPGMSLYFPTDAPDGDTIRKMYEIKVHSMTDAMAVFTRSHFQRLETNPDAMLNLIGISSCQVYGVSGEGAAIYGGTNAALEQYVVKTAVDLRHRNVFGSVIVAGCMDNGRHRRSEEEFNATRIIGERTPRGILEPGSAVAMAIVKEIAGCELSNQVGNIVFVDGGHVASGRVDCRVQPTVKK